MKGVFVVLDGVADQPCRELGQKTPLEAAKTPNLDGIAKKSKIDYCYTVKEGFVPGSDAGVISLLGYDFIFERRGPLEAIGLGVKIQNGDLAFRCNFATVDDLESGDLLDRRAGRTLSNRESRALAKSINERVKIGFPFEFYPSVQHRGALIVRGGFSDNISDVEAGNGKLSFSKSLDDEDDSKLSAEIVNKFVRHSHEVLDSHPINVARARKGLFSANAILCRGAGSEIPRFKKLKGKWIALGYMPLEIGIAKVTGMDVWKFRYPKFRGMDVYSNLYVGLKKAIKNSIKMLRRNRDKYDYLYVHFKETDIPGHDGKPLEKVKMIELLDKKFFSFLKKYIKEGKLIVTADHTTACRMKAHTSDPVPVLSYPHDKKFHGGKRFTEEEGRKGRRIIGRKLLEEKLFKRK